MPYAEMRGDRADLALAKEDLDVVAAVKAAGVPVVTVVVSGRPMVLGNAFENSNAILAAWLPGTEGQGVADVLFGDYKPTGKLSFSWQKQFAYGYGLSY
jgi:beta-glucosidase